jgi:hypothetical protein
MYLAFSSTHFLLVFSEGTKKKTKNAIKDKVTKTLNKTNMVT